MLSAQLLPSPLKAPTPTVKPLKRTWVQQLQEVEKRCCTSWVMFPSWSNSASPSHFHTCSGFWKMLWSASVHLLSLQNKRVISKPSVHSYLSLFAVYSSNMALKPQTGLQGSALVSVSSLILLPNADHTWMDINWASSTSKFCLQNMRVLEKGIQLS